MGKGGSFNGNKPPTKLISKLYSNGSDYDENGNRIDGICKHCNEWAAELVDGACKDADCKRARLQKKIEDGTAVKFDTDMIGKDGKVGTYIERGKEKVFVEKKK